MTMLSLALVALTLAASPQGGSVDQEGFIRNWLVLAPVPIEGDSGAGEIERDLVKGEAALTPKPGDRVTIGPGQEVTWTPHQASDFFIDFLESFGKARGEYVAGYAVAYITADADMPVTLALSTNDQGKAWLNGKPVFTFSSTRTLEKDSDKVEVTLVKGQNVLVLKVINEINNWQACARFLKGGAPVTNLKVSSTPQ